jgi:hypothetical protein
VRELLQSASAQELTDWAAYERLTGPLDLGHRADVHAGIIAATVANVMRARGSRRFTPEDFVPPWGGRREQTWQEQLAAVVAINKALGGKDRRRKPPGGGDP